MRRGERKSAQHRVKLRRAEGGHAVRILIAEDDAVSRLRLKATLENQGHEVVVAGDGAEAWRALQTEDAPRLALLDWMMPEMDGVEVCRRVRERTQLPYLYLILLTARDRQEDIVEGLKA